MPYVETLEATDIAFGKVLWNALRGNKSFPADGAFWHFQSESGRWHLLIASPRVDQIGPREAYRELLDITRRMSVESDQFMRIELISPMQPLYQALRSVFGTTASVEGSRLGSTQIGGRYIDDAYLYEIR